MKVRSLAVLVTCLVLLVAGASGLSKELVIASHTLPRTLDPFYDTEVYSMTIYRLMFDSLVEADENGIPSPVLAESWSVLDQVTWQLKLRQGVRWHNGDQFTAADVKYSLEYILDPVNKCPWRGRINLIAAVQVVDDYTVNLVTNGPWSGVLQGLMVEFIVPKGYHDNTGKFDPVNYPVGTGRYRFLSWRLDGYITLEVNTKYWGEPPTIPIVTYKLMEDVATRLAALEAGEVDIAFALLPEHTASLKAKGLVVDWIPLGQITDFNFVSVREDVPTDKVFADKRIRQAVNYAIDKQSIVDGIWLGYGKVLDAQIVGSDGFGYNPALKAYPYDPPKARQLLAEAGYPADLVFDVQVCAGEPKLKEVGEAVVAMLRDVGMKAQLVVLERAVWLEKIYASGYSSFYWMGWQYMPAMDATLPLSFFQCPGKSPIFHMCNQQFDELYAKVLAEFDTEKRLGLLQELAALFREEAPMVFLFQRAAIYGLNPQVRNVKLRADGGVDYFQAYWED